MKILLMGGTGAMGTHLVEAFKGKPYEVVVTSRKQRRSFGNITYVQGNAKDEAFLDYILQEHYVAIYNFMTYTATEFSSVCNKLLRATDHYFFLSSCRVYANSDSFLEESSIQLLDAVTDEEYRQSNNYALAKAKEENILKSSGFSNWTIIRPYLTYGEDRLQLGFYEQGQWLNRAIHKNSIVFSKDLANKYTTLTYARDVANILAELMNNPKSLGEIIQITCEKELLWNDVLQIYIQELQNIGINVKVNMLPSAPINSFVTEKWTYLYDRLYNRKFRSNKLTNILGYKYKFTNPNDGLKKCLSAYVEKHPNPQLQVDAMASLDRITGEVFGASHFPNKKTYLKYLFKRYCPFGVSIIKMLKSLI